MRETHRIAVFPSTDVIDGSGFNFIFSPTDCYENEAWKVAEKLLALMPESASIECYDLETGVCVWSGEVVARVNDEVTITGRFGLPPDAVPH